MYFELASEITASSRSRLVGASPIPRAFGGGMARGAGASSKELLRSACAVGGFGVRSYTGMRPTGSGG